LLNATVNDYYAFVDTATHYQARLAAAASAIDLVRVSGSNVGFEQGSILYGLIFLASQHVCQTRDAYSASMFCVEHASSV